MDCFPEFMKHPSKQINASQQNTQDIEGYYCESADGSQMAYWEYSSNRTSSKHTHLFDEYMVCVNGEYIVYMDGKEFVLTPGDELLIPSGTEQWGKCKAGTRTIHAFGGKRIG
jgi:quercetin dioxygenase-like cupin family protein